MFQLMQNAKKSLQRGIPPIMDFKSQDFIGYRGLQASLHIFFVFIFATQIIAFTRRFFIGTTKKSLMLDSLPIISNRMSYF